MKLYEIVVIGSIALGVAVHWYRLRKLRLRESAKESKTWRR